MRVILLLEGRGGKRRRKRGVYLEEPSGCFGWTSREGGREGRKESEMRDDFGIACRRTVRPPEQPRRGHLLWEDSGDSGEMCNIFRDRVLLPLVITGFDLG